MKQNLEQEATLSQKLEFLTTMPVRLGLGIALLTAGIFCHGWVAVALHLAAYAVLGLDVLYRALLCLCKLEALDENVLMSVATIGAMALGDFPEAVAVMLFFQTGELLGDIAVRRGRGAIAQLMDIRPDFARVVHRPQGTPDFGAAQRIDTPAIAHESSAPQASFDFASIEENAELQSPEDVSVGSVILIRPSEKIPLDGIVLQGESLLDTRSLTGESLPRSVSPGDNVHGGCVNQTGLLAVRVTHAYHESTVGKILDLVENATEKKAKVQQFITAFSRIYTPVVVGSAALLALLPPLLLGSGFAVWVQRALVFLVISCPCALVISVPLTHFCGIAGASRRGILIKGSNHLDALGRLSTVVFDKTGTLTKGQFEVAQILPAQGFSQETLLALAAGVEAHSAHPIALSIRNAYKGPHPQALVEVQEIPGFGVSARIDGKTVLAGNLRLMRAHGIVLPAPGDNPATPLPAPADKPATQLSASGEEFAASLSASGDGFDALPGTTGDESAETTVHVAYDDRYAGSIIVADTLRPDSTAALSALRELGIRLAMLTGDRLPTAKNVANQLGIHDYAAELLPQQKVERLEEIRKNTAPYKSHKSSKKAVAFVGDGMNDAPVLACADVGIAMGGLGSDAAIEAADVVIMTDEPSKVAQAVGIARRTRRIVLQNIVLSLGVKGVTLTLGAFGLANLWIAVVADVGVMLVAVLNALRAMRVKG